MRFWIVSTGEPLPQSGEGKRLMRGGQLANILAARGHNVTWISSTFDHTSKTQLCTKNQTVSLANDLQLVTLYARAYKKNVSFQRILHHRETAAAFHHWANSEPAPDAILCCMPTIELCAAVARYGTRNQVPYVIDVRDIWPDMWVEYFPVILQPLVRFLLRSYDQQLAEAVRRATSVTGVSSTAVTWARAKAGQGWEPLDRCFYLSFSRPQISDEAMASARSFWAGFPQLEQPDTFVIAYVGSFMHRLHFGDALSAAERLYKSHGNKFVFVFCGAGPQNDLVAAASRRLPNVIAPGWISPAQAEVLYARANAGLLPYPNASDFPLVLPNKFGEYVSHGLPIISSLEGNAGNLIAEYGCGLIYQPGDGHALAEVISDTQRQPQRLSEMHRGALLLAPRFDAGFVYNSFADHLETVGGKRAPS